MNEPLTDLNSAAKALAEELGFKHSGSLIRRQDVEAIILRYFTAFSEAMEKRVRELIIATGLTEDENSTIGMVSSICDLAVKLRAERDQLAGQREEEMLRVKMCEHIAEGEEGWEQFRNLCPSTMAVATLRDQLTSLRAQLAKEQPKV